jgi:hypothetical protein
MIRLLIAATFLGVAAAPAFACQLSDSASTDTKPATVASQPADDHGTPPPAPATTAQQPG